MYNIACNHLYIAKISVLIKINSIGNFSCKKLSKNNQRSYEFGNERMVICSFVTNSFPNVLQQEIWKSLQKHVEI